MNDLNDLNQTGPNKNWQARFLINRIEPAKTYSSGVTS